MRFLVGNKCINDPCYIKAIDIKLFYIAILLADLNVDVGDGSLNVTCSFSNYCFHPNEIFVI